MAEKTIDVKTLHGDFYVKPINFSDKQRLKGIWEDLILEIGKEGNRANEKTRQMLGFAADIAFDNPDKVFNEFEDVDALDILNEITLEYLDIPTFTPGD